MKVVDKFLAVAILAVTAPYAVADRLEPGHCAIQTKKCTWAGDKCYYRWHRFTNVTSCKEGVGKGFIIVEYPCGQRVEQKLSWSVNKILFKPYLHKPVCGVNPPETDTDT